MIIFKNKFTPMSELKKMRNKVAKFKTFGMMTNSKDGLIIKNFKSFDDIFSTLENDKECFWDKKNIAFYAGGNIGGFQPLPIVSELNEFKNYDTDVAVIINLNDRVAPRVINKVVSLEKQIVLEVLSTFKDDTYRQKIRWISNWNVLPRGNYVFLHKDFDFSFYGNFKTFDNQKITIKDMLNKTNSICIG